MPTTPQKQTPAPPTPPPMLPGGWGAPNFQFPQAPPPPSAFDLSTPITGEWSPGPNPLPVMSGGQPAPGQQRGPHGAVTPQAAAPQTTSFQQQMTPHWSGGMMDPQGNILASDAGTLSLADHLAQADGSWWNNPSMLQPGPSPQGGYVVTPQNLQRVGITPDTTPEQLQEMLRTNPQLLEMFGLGLAGSNPMMHVPQMMHMIQQAYVPVPQEGAANQEWMAMQADMQARLPQHQPPASPLLGSGMLPAQPGGAPNPMGMQTGGPLSPGVPVAGGAPGLPGMPGAGAGVGATGAGMPNLPGGGVGGGGTLPGTGAAGAPGAPGGNAATQPGGHLGDYAQREAALLQQAAGRTDDLAAQHLAREAQVMDLLQQLGLAQRTDINALFDQAGADQRQMMINRGLSNTTVLPSVLRGVEHDRSRELQRLGETLTAQQANALMQLTGDRLGAQQATTGDQLSLGAGLSSDRLGAEQSALAQWLQAQAGLSGQQTQALMAMMGDQANALSGLMGDMLGFMERRDDVGPDMGQMLALLQALGASGAATGTAVPTPGQQMFGPDGGAGFAGGGGGLGGAGTLPGMPGGQPGMPGLPGMGGGGLPGLVPGTVPPGQEGMAGLPSGAGPAPGQMIPGPGYGLPPAMGNHWPENVPLPPIPDGFQPNPGGAGIVGPPGGGPVGGAGGAPPPPGWRPMDPGFPVGPNNPLLPDPGWMGSMWGGGGGTPAPQIPLPAAIGAK